MVWFALLIDAKSIFSAHILATGINIPAFPLSSLLSSFLLYRFMRSDSLLLMSQLIYSTIMRSVNIRSAVMSSQTAASRIPIPVKIETVSAKPNTASQSRIPVKIGTVAAKLPTTARRSPPTDKIADIASSLSAMTISKPKSLPSNVSAANRASASARIQKRRELVVAKLGLPSSTKRPKASVKATVSVKAPVPAIVPVSAPSTSLKLSRIPTYTTATLPSSPPPSPSASSPPPRPKRGSSPYCPARIAWPREEWYQPLGYGLARRGQSCHCHGRAPYQLPVHPSQWSTTPAEADVDLGRKRYVRFTDISKIDEYERYLVPGVHVWPGGSPDPTTKLDDARGVDRNPTTADDYEWPDDVF